MGDAERVEEEVFEGAGWGGVGGREMKGGGGGGRRTLQHMRANWRF